MRHRLVLTLLAQEGITANAAQCKYMSKYIAQKPNILSKYRSFWSTIEILPKYINFRQKSKNLPNIQILLTNQKFLFETYRILVNNLGRSSHVIGSGVETLGENFGSQIWVEN